MPGATASPKTLINRLSRIQQLRVAPRAPGVSGRGHSPDLTAIGRELNVRALSSAAWCCAATR